MTKAQASSTLIQLIRQYGTCWNINVPRSAWDQMALINATLSDFERRQAVDLGMRLSRLYPNDTD